MTMADLSEVNLEFYLPASQAHLVALGSEARIKLDVVDAVVPATVTFVSPASQFTPREVETADERQNLVFRIRVRVPQELVEGHIEHVRTGILDFLNLIITMLTGAAVIRERGTARSNI